MNSNPADKAKTNARKSRRWLLGLEPIFEGGRKGKRAQAWHVEDELIAVAFLGDVTIDLSNVSSAPAEVRINAYAILRDVDIYVAEGTQVELSGSVVRGDLTNDVPAVPEANHDRLVRIHGHAVLGDVKVRLAGGA
ncbi:MAG TPA: LiaF domain-containing protein [Streptosporangiaceae bacterium]|nr:LiaF domain-containing protein [Streptosporangiaceae bacterium]